MTNFKIGFGNDVHRLEAGGKLILGGVEIASERGAVGHSDADALAHAVTDAILGALALGDIGTHFSDKDNQWKHADSFLFLRYTVGMMKEKGYAVGNIDTVVNLEQPKLRPHIDKMRENLAAALEISVECVSVKAKTGEKIGAVGENRAVRTEAVVLLREAAD